MSLMNHSIKELEEKLHNKEITAEDLVDASIHRIKEVDDEIQAFLTLDEEKAKEKAKSFDKEETQAKSFVLPIGIKDNILTKNLRTTAASLILKNFNDASYDATVVQKLHEEKAITIGKSNMDEFAMGSSTENSSYTKTRSP